MSKKLSLVATQDNVVLRHIPEKEQQTATGLLLPKGAKGMKNQVTAFEVMSIGRKVEEIKVGDIVLAPDAMKIMHKPGQRGVTTCLMPDLVDDAGDSFVVVTEEYCKAVIRGL